MRIEENILTENKKWLEKQVAKVSKRCVKMGVDPLTLTFGQNFTEKVKDIGPGGREITRVYNYTPVVIEGELPQHKGWDLVSVFEKKEGVVLSRTVPGKSLPEELLPEKIQCQHCGYNRNRKSSVLLQHVDTGEYKEVGTSCLHDFVGYKPEAWIHYANTSMDEIFAIANDVDRLPKQEIMHDLVEFLAITSAVIHIYGWTSAGAAYQNEALTSTVHRVSQQFDKRENPKWHQDVPLVEYEETDKEFAKKAIAWMNEQDNRKEYIFNCQNIIEMDAVPMRYQGIAASIVGSYKRHLDREAKIQHENEGKTNEWVGEIKERLRLKNIKVVSAKEIENDWGGCTLWGFEDEEGRKFKWFATGSLCITYRDRQAEYANVGDIIDMDATVKRHDTYRGSKQTLINRCKVKKFVKRNE
jgi:hypothetical protein